jgi:flagellar hook-length control protein FliK
MRGLFVSKGRIVPSTASEVSRFSSHQPSPSPRRPAEAPESPFGDLLDAATPPPDRGPAPPSRQKDQTQAPDGSGSAQATSSSSAPQDTSTQPDAQGDPSQQAATDTTGDTPANAITAIKAKLVQTSQTGTTKPACNDGDSGQSIDPNAKSADPSTTIVPAVTVAPSATIDPSLIPAATVVAPTISTTPGTSAEVTDQADAVLIAAAPGSVPQKGNARTNKAGDLPAGILPTGDLATGELEAANTPAAQSSTDSPSPGKAPTATVPSGKVSLDQMTDMPIVQGPQSVADGSATNPSGIPVGRKSTTPGTARSLDARKDPVRQTTDDATAATGASGEPGDAESSQATADQTRPPVPLEAPRHTPETIAKAGTSARPESDTRITTDKSDPLPLATLHAHAADQIAAAAGSASSTTATIGQTPQTALVQPAAGDPTAIPIAGLALEIAARAQAGSTRFEIRLDPPELGRVDVRLDVDRHGQVTSHLVVEKAETLDLLRRDAPELERALQQAGLKTGDDGLQFSLRDQGFSGRNPQPGNDDAARLVVPDPDLPQIEAVASSYGRDLRLGSGIDIRI